MDKKKDFFVYCGADDNTNELFLQDSIMYRELDCKIRDDCMCKMKEFVREGYFCEYKDCNVSFLFLIKSSLFHVR